jgi:hypothetical protein
MTTANDVMTRALALASTGADDEAAVGELMDCCHDNRVAVVMARRRVLEEGDGQDAGHVARAAELLESVLARLPEA